MSLDSKKVSRRKLLIPLDDGNRQRAEQPESFSGRDYFVPKEEEQPATELGQSGFSRRGFLKTVSIAAAATAVAASSNPLDAAPSQIRHDVVAALGDTLIPSDPGNPGYKDLEPYKITDEVLKALPGISDADATLFNERPRLRFGGKTFLELNEPQRAQYLHSIIDGTAVNDSKALETLRRFYRNTRRRVMTLYYSNFPQNQWSRNNHGMPVMMPGNLHQITNPNTKQLTTGWDQSGFFGPLTWEEEERRRNLMKKIHWHDNWSPFDYQPERPKRT